jgi:hypothetical protein
MLPLLPKLLKTVMVAPVRCTSGHVPPKTIVIPPPLASRGLPPVGRTSVAPSALHTLFFSVTWWRAHNLLELGTDSHTEVVPAPQGGRLW